MKATLTNDEFREQLAGFRRSAFRLEVKPAYLVDGERGMYARFLAGGVPDPGGDRYYLDWLDNMAQRIDAGVTLTRVRVTDTPLTEYQRFLQWSDRLNRNAGEAILYLDRAKAVRAGLPARTADPDWWMFDDERLLVITHDSEGRRMKADLVTDDEAVQQARLWRDLAITTAREENE